MTQLGCDNMVLEKIIIVPGKSLLSGESTELLDSVVMVSEGNRVDNVVYIHEDGVKIDEYEDIVTELPEDGYNEDELDVETIPVYHGNNACIVIAEQIYNNWNSDTMVLIYDPTEEIFNEIASELLKLDSDIKLEDFYSIFRDGKDMDLDIYQLMETKGIRSNMINKESIVSMGYFLGVLVEQVYDR
jgi:hypothetical protein